MLGANTEALEYYNKCLGLLIESVSEQDGQVTEEVLAAIAVLRQYEEMDGMYPSIQRDVQGELGTLRLTMPGYGASS